MKKNIFLVLFFSINLFSNERIVTLAPSVNEIVFALGLGEEVVANTRYCNYPKKSKSIKKVGGYASISLEKILKVKPSVVIAQDYDKKLIQNLNSLGIKTKSYKTTTINHIKSTILDLGKYFDKEQKALELTNSIDKNLKQLENIVTNKKVLIVISPKKDLKNQIYVSGNHLYFEDIIKASKNKNAFFSTSKMQPVVNVEKIIKMNPDIVVILAPFFDGKTKELNEVKNAWRKLPISASKYNNIYAVDKLYAGIPSQRVIYFIKDFKKILQDVRDKKLQ